jgi:hypothetical protein
MRLYARVLGRFGAVPTLLEWDRNLPDFAMLLDERARIGAVLEAAARVSA